MSTIKIAITLNTAWNIYNFRRPLIRSLQEAGYQVVCFAPADDHTRLLADEDIEVHPILHLSRKGKNPMQDIRLIRELKRAYLAHQIDLAIHFTIKPNIYGCVAAYQANIPSVAVVTGLGYTFLSSGLSSRVARVLYRYAFRRNTLTIFQNPDDRALFIRQNLVRKEQSTVILGSGIDTERYTPDTPVPAAPVYLFIGRLLYDKGIRELLEGFSLFSKRYPKAELVVVGDPDPHNPASISAEELVAYRELENIRFAGFQADVRSFIRRASVVVLPSYREGVPRTLLEALSMGRPGITTDVPGCREVVIPDKNGFLISSHDAGAVADAMERYYLLDDAQKQRMGHRSCELAEEKFSTEVVNEAFVRYIEGFASLRRGSPSG